jgi:hypothetical protein
LSHASSEFAALLEDSLSSLQPLFIDSISEFDLITLLKKTPYCLYDDAALNDPLMLFQTHFVLFHCLYQLRKKWRSEGVGELDIGLTRISLKMYEEHQGKPECTLQQQDSLADYYLDWSNLSATGADDVEALLDSFWQKMEGADLSHDLCEKSKKEACERLEIENINTHDLKSLKSQYRKLQHQYHPDKGGSNEHSQALLQAYTQLRKYLIRHRF